jgi:hypothetical protein
MGGAFWNFGNLWWLGYLLAKNFDATFAKKCAKFRHGSIAATACLGRLSRRYRLPVLGLQF